MKLSEMVNPTKVSPGKKEQEARKEIASKMMNVIIKADQGKLEHNKIFFLAKSIVDDDEFLNDVSEIELETSKEIQRSRIRVLSNSKLPLIKLNSMLKQMENIVRK